ncbi:9802_t:CDS:2, partial [Acaulospora colombiana]
VDDEENHEYEERSYSDNVYDHVTSTLGNIDKDSESDESGSVTSFSSEGSVDVKEDIMPTSEFLNLSSDDDLNPYIQKNIQRDKLSKKRDYEQELPVIRDVIQEPLTKRSRSEKNTKSKKKSTLHPDFPTVEDRHKKEQSSAAKFEDLLATFQANDNSSANRLSGIKANSQLPSAFSSSPSQRQQSSTRVDPHQYLSKSLLSTIQRAASAVREYHKKQRLALSSSVAPKNFAPEEESDLLDDEDDLRLKPEQLEKLRNSKKIREFLRDDTLREIIYFIDNAAKSPKVEELLDAARLNDEIFHDFTEEILNLVTTRDSDD